MAVKTSLELLAQIAEELDILLGIEVTQLKKNNEQPPQPNGNSSPQLVDINIDGNDDVVSLLMGMSQLSSKSGVGDVGELVEALSKGMLAFSKMDSKAIQTAADLIANLSNTLNNIKVDNNTIDGIHGISEFLNASSNLTEDSIRNLVNMGTFFTAEMAKNIVGFMNNLVLSDPNGAIASAAALKYIFSGFAGLMAVDIAKLLKAIDELDPDKAKKLANFINALCKSIKFDPNQRLENLAGLGAGLNAILNINLNSTFMKLNPIRARLLGWKLANFLKVMTDTAVSRGKGHIGELGLFMQAYVSMLDIVLNMDSKKFKKAMKTFKKIDDKSWDSLGKFLGILTKTLPNDKDTGITWERASKGMSAFIQALVVGGSLKNMAALRYLSSFASKERGEKIHDFFKEMLKILDDKHSAKDVKAFGDLINAFGNVLLKIVASIGIMIGLILIFKPETILASIGIVTLVVLGMVGVCKLLTTGGGNNSLLKGVDGLETLTKALLLVVGAIGIMTLIVAFNKDKNVFTALTIIAVTISGLVLAAKFLTGENEKDVIAGVKGLQLLVVALMITVGAIGLVTMIYKMAKPEEVWTAVGIVALTIMGLVIAAKQLVDTEESNISLATKNMMYLVGALMVVVMAIGIMTLITKENKWEDLTIGIITVLATIGVLVWAANALTDTEESNITLATKNLTYLVASLVITVVAIGMMTWIAKENEMLDILLGIGIVYATIGVLVAATWALSKIDNKTAEHTTALLVVLTGMLVVISLVTKFLIVPIGKEATDAALGALVVMGMLGLLVGMVWFISNKIDETGVKQSMMLLGFLTLMLAVVTLITQHLIIPIGKEAEAAALGGTVIMSIMGILTGIAYIVANKFEPTEIFKSITVMVAMALILAGISWITNEYIIPIGKEAEAAAYGGAIVMSIIGILTGVVYVITNKVNKDDTVKTIAIMAAMGIILGGVAWIVNEFIIPIGKHAEEALYGGAIVLGIIGGLTAIVWAVSKIAKNPKDILIAEGIIASLGAVLWLLGEALYPYIDLAIYVSDKKAALALGSLAIVALLGSWGLIMAGLGAIVTSSFGTAALLMAEGAAIIDGVGLVLGMLGMMLPPYIDLAIRLSETLNDVKTGTGVILLILSDFSVLMMKLGLLSVPLLLGEATVGLLSNVIRSLSVSITEYAQMLNYLKENDITVDSVQGFAAIMTGKNGVISTLLDIISKMDDLSMWGLVKVQAFGQATKPLFETMSTFMDIISKMINLNYVSKWNDDGTPAAYKSIKATQFGQAARTITNAFFEFVTKMAEGFDKVSLKTFAIIELMSETFSPLMESVGTFTNAIVQVLTLGIPDEWDENGKPKHYSPFNPENFGQAAHIITLAFFEFVREMNTSLLGMDEDTAEVIDILSRSIGPVMESVGSFTNAILEYCKGFDYIDDEGKNHHVDFDPQAFADAATHICDAFVQFITKLKDGLSKYAGEDSAFSIDYYFGFPIIHFKSAKKGELALVMDSLQGISNVMAGTFQLTDKIKEYIFGKDKIDTAKLAAGARNIALSVVDFAAILIKGFTASNIKKFEDIAELLEDDELSPTAVAKYINDLFNDKNGLMALVNLQSKRPHTNFGAIVVKMLTSFTDGILANFDGSETEAKKWEKIAKLISGDSFEDIIDGISDMMDDLKDLYDDDKGSKAIESVNSFLQVFDKILSLKDKVGEPEIISQTIANAAELVKKMTTTLASAYDDMYNAYFNYLTRLEKIKEKSKATYKAMTNRNDVLVSSLISLNDAYNALHKSLKSKESERDKMMIKMKDLFKGIADEINNVNRELGKYVENKSKANALEALRQAAATAKESESVTTRAVEKGVTKANNTSAATSSKNTSHTSSPSSPEQKGKNTATHKDIEQEKWSTIGRIIGDAVKQSLMKKWSITVNIDKTLTNSNKTIMAGNTSFGT